MIIAVTLIGAFLYFYKLGEVPNGLYVDEATTGYNAYSILKTGKDEYGKSFPVLFRFFGSYSPPIYTYLTSLSIGVFGLSIFSVRFVSALSGVMSALVFAFFLQTSGVLKKKSSVALGTFLFVISPWNVFFARAGYETYFGFFVFSLGVLFSWISVKKPKYLMLALPLLSFSTYGAHTERFVVPIFGLAYFLVFRKELFRKKSKKCLLWGMGIGLFIQIPHLILLRTGALFSKNTLFYKDAVAREADKILFMPRLIAWPLSFFREFFSQYVSYYSPRNLFFLPDSDPQRSVPELSVFYPWMILLYFVGIWVLYNRRRKLFFKFLIMLLFVLPVPIALTGTPFSTQRALPLLLPLSIVISIGVDAIVSRTLKIVWVPVGGFLIFLSLVLLWRSYFVLLPGERAGAWNWGFRELARETQNRPKEMFLIDQSRLKPAYIELAFFLKYPPEKFQKMVDPEIRDDYYNRPIFNEDYSFSNIRTGSISWENDPCIEQILVGDEFAISSDQAEEHGLEKIFEIRDPVDYIVFVGWRTDPHKKCLD